MAEHMSEKTQDFLHKRFCMAAEKCAAMLFDIDLIKHDFIWLSGTSDFFGLSEEALKARVNCHGWGSIASLVRSFVFSADCSAVLEAHEKNWACGPVSFCCRLVTQQGRTMWVDVWYRVFCDDAGSPFRVQGWLGPVDNGRVEKKALELFVYDQSDYVVLVDARTNTFLQFSDGSGRGVLYDNYGDYGASVKDYAERYVVEEEREYCLKQMSIAHMLNELETKKFHSFYVGMQDPKHGYARKQVKCSYYDRERQLLLLTRIDVTKIYIAQQDAERKLKEALTLAKTDPLTGLFNKSSTEQLIQNILRGFAHQTHALMMLDVDNFKGVNDNLGHMFGDAVLYDVALKLKKLFRSHDVVGRVGGDEFMVLMVDIDDEDTALRKADEIRAQLRQTFAGVNGDYTISCSIGIVMGSGGSAFSQLYQQADKALYAAKHKGKDCYFLYNESMDLPLAVPAAATDVSPWELATVDQARLRERLFEVMYTSVDFSSSLQMALGLLGQIFNLSRVYIYENSWENICTVKTFEWCNAGVTPHQDRQPLQLFAGLYDGANSHNRGYYCSDVEDAPATLRPLLYEQSVKSFLLMPIVQCGRVTGYIGFDECARNRVFSSKECNMLSFSAKILAIFLQKQRLAESGERDFLERCAVLDGLPHVAYVVTSDYALLFVNEEGKKMYLNMRSKCHEAFHGLSQPCEGCPVTMCGTEKVEVRLDHALLRMQGQVCASPLTWGGREQCVLVSWR